MSHTQQDSEREELFAEFAKTVNLPAGQLERWLGTEESRNAGRHKGQSESTGHAMGRRIVHLLRTRKADFTAEDLTHMRKTVRHVNRQLKQRPRGDVSETAWRFSLMNWGHDPQR